MSIVTEALRKAQKDRFQEKEKFLPKKEGSSLDDIYSLSGSSEHKTKERRVKSSWNILFTSVFSFFIVIFLGVLFFLWMVKFSARQRSFMADKKQPVKNVEQNIQQTINDQYEKVIPFEQNKSIPKISTSFVQASLPLLNGIMFSSENPTAILNDSIVSPGDIVSGFKVIRISPRTVEISKNSETYKLEL